MDNDLTITLRTLRSNLGSDQHVLAWLREAYRVKRNLLAGRGYASPSELDHMAAERADEIHGEAGHEISPLIKGLRLYSGMGFVQANFEAYDPNLE